MRTFCIILLSALFFQNSQAQTRKVVADKIIGVVGDKIILQSDVKNSILDAQRQGHLQDRRASAEGAHAAGAHTGGKCRGAAVRLGARSSGVCVASGHGVSDSNGPAGRTSWR